MRDNWTERDEILVNTRLLTKDGRRIGNAIVRMVGAPFPADSFEVITDYGSVLILTVGEIRELFYVADVAEPDHKHYSKARYPQMVGRALRPSQSADSPKRAQIFHHMAQAAGVPVFDMGGPKMVAIEDLDKALATPGLSRYYLKEPDETTTKEMAYFPLTGLPMGYPETDAHFRARILKAMEAQQ